MRMILGFAIAVLFHCCVTKTDNEKDRIIANQQRKISALEKEKQKADQASPPHDTAMPGTSTKVAVSTRISSLPKGMFDTYPQLINNIFAEGSTLDEVINIL